MQEWFDSFSPILSGFPVAIAQGLPVDVFKSSDVDPTFLVYILGGIVTLILVTIYGTYRYKKWKKFKEFESEMKSLDLAPEDEGTLADMVKRFSMDEPVNILFSARLFDEMASSEIKRVLGSPASAKLKQDFIDKVYMIRTKTYHPDWLNAGAKEEGIERAESLIS
jgi:hypothetical protein